MAKALSLLEQVRIREKENQLKAKIELKAGMNGSEMLKVLLPNYNQLTKPSAFHAAKQLHKGLRGGVRSGKTYTLMAEAILLSYLNRPYYHLSLSPSFDLARVTVVPVLTELCEQNNLHYNWSDSKNLFTIIWGRNKKDIANILIYGADANFKGITAASGDLNEPFSISKEKFLVWWERISHPKAVRLERCWGGTAEPEKMTWGHEYFKMKSNRKIYLDTITTYDNIFLSPDYIRQLEDKYDAKLRRVYMLGECVNLSANKLYHSFDSTVNIKSYKEVYSEIIKKTQNVFIIGYDFNVNPMCATLWWINGIERIQINEFKISGSNTRELTELILHYIESYILPYCPDSSFIITGDASGRKSDTRSYLSSVNDYYIIKDIVYQKIRYTFAVPQSNPFVWDRVSTINNLFYKKVLYICDNCVDSIEDRELVAWKQGAENFHVDKNMKNSKGETVSHLSDAGDYAIINTMPLVDITLSGGDNRIYTSRRARAVTGTPAARFIAEDWTSVRVESYLKF